ncbi:MAG: 2,3-bisphosphoglycerate-independent phosphoglycerate mutase [bacterium]
MDYLDLMKELSIKTPSRIVMVVLDGLGGAEMEEGGATELEAARTPNMDELVRHGVCGLMDPIAPGITPGSGPSHLALFGYDPVRYKIGRGILAAAGIGFALERGDVAARGNFATIGADGKITDRRAGRITTEENRRLCGKIGDLEVDGVRTFIRPVREHRCVVVFRGEGLSGRLTDSDPQKEGREPKRVEALGNESGKTAAVVNRYLDRVHEILKDEHPANMMLMRGFDIYPHLPSMREVYRLTPAAVAVYPDYRGIARLIGMDVLEPGEAIEDEIRTLLENYDRYDYFYLHFKKTDSKGEDGDFDGKVHVIEEVDRHLPLLLESKPDVVVVTGDHSTPALLKSHSWHPLPVIIRSRYCRRDGVEHFTEKACAGGGLGRIRAVELMTLAMANALKLLKFGA